MANKKKPKKSSARKPAQSKAPLKKAASKKKVAAKKPARKKVVVKSKKKVVLKATIAKKPATKKKPARKATRLKVNAPVRTQGLDTVEIERGMVRRKSGVLSGDMQGLSRKAGAASESVEELLEEGNAFEAGILQGVEDAEEADEDEVLTHEVLADDVPKEYLDED